MWSYHAKLIDVPQDVHERVNVLVGLLAAMVFLAIGTYGLFFGRAWNSIYGWFYRDKNRVIYWMEILGFFATAGWLIWHFLPFLL